MKKFFILLVSTIFLTLTFTSCNKENKDDDFVNSTWVNKVSWDGHSETLALTFSNGNVTLSYYVDESSTPSWVESGIYEKNNSIVTMIIDTDDYGPRIWTGTINGRIMTVDKDNMIFIKQ